MEQAPIVKHATVHVKNAQIQTSVIVRNAMLLYLEVYPQESANAMMVIFRMVLYVRLAITHVKNVRTNAQFFIKYI